MYTTLKTRDNFQKYTGKDIQFFKDTMIRDIKAMKMHLLGAIYLEHVIEKRLKLQSKNVYCNLIQALDASLVVTECSETESENSSETSSSEPVNEIHMQMQKGKVDIVKALYANVVVTESSGTESEKHDTSSRSENDTHIKDADIRPVKDKEPIDEVQLTDVYDLLANEQQQVEKPKIINDGRVD
nr:hypothetical protein [Tanacetum cinerariifolium]GEZ25298.1 hypothetical protein [Tanacetum cinerariifolium]